MATARSSTAFRRERNSLSSMHDTIADAIDDSNSDLTPSVCYCTIPPMTTKIPLTRQALRLKALVDKAGGPSAFADQYSKYADENAINAVYVSQILNGTRPFGDKSRRNMAARAGLPEDYFEIIHEARDSAALAYLESTVQFIAADELEVIELMREVDSEARRNIVGAARLAATEFRLRQKNSTKRAGQ